MEYPLLEGESSVQRICSSLEGGVAGLQLLSGDGEKQCRKVRPVVDYQVYWVEIKYGSQHCTKGGFNTMELHEITRKRG